MKIAVITGSHRSNSQSLAVARWVESALQKQDMQAVLFDVSTMDLPFWSEDFWNKESALAAQWKPFSDRLHQCDGIVVISPEWAGMIPPKLVNFFLLCGNQELSYKPALLIGVSAGMSGTYPIAQLRMNASKNNQMVYLPDHLIVRNAKNFLQPTPDAIKGSSKDPESPLNQRLQYNVRVLQEMTVGLAQVRKAIDVKRYPFGL